MKKVYIIGGLRTPVAKTGGAFKNILPEKLGALVLNGISEKYKVCPNYIDQVILGNAVGTGGNIARVTLLEAGWPESIPGITIDFQCGSGMSAVNLAASQILAGQADLIITGGIESTSLAPKRQFNEKDPRYDEKNPFYQRAPFAPENFADPDMGVGAEKLGELVGITREEMDAQALLSHQRAKKATEEGLFEDIIIPINIDDKIIKKDESVRNITEKLLKRMPPVFVEDGKITAGNSCLTHDGAAGVLLASEEAIKRYNLKPEGLFLDGIHVGVQTNLFPLAPVKVINDICKKNNLKINEIDLIEINEAFAVKVIACSKELKISQEKVNILGGALAYGHPYGASGCIILLHLLKALEYSKGKTGIAAIGVGGGTGSGILLERL